MKIPAYLAILILLFSKPLLADTQQLLQLIDYVGVDYAEAVHNNVVINEAEYAEMQDFSAGIRQHLMALPDGETRVQLLYQSEQLSLFIEQKESAGKVRQLTTEMHQLIINAFQVTAVPRIKPDLKKAKVLYAEHCVSCHGQDGYGDGGEAIGMEPPPINFRDIERYKHRTLFGLYNTITQGVSDTGMQSFAQLSDTDRWSLAFYVGGLAVTPDQVDIQESPLLDIKTLTTTAPAEAARLDKANGVMQMAYLRHHPEVYFTKKDHLGFAQQRLKDVIVAYKSNDADKAYQYAVEAYLEGFELMENAINTLDKPLRLDIEHQMTQLRNLIRAGVPHDTIETEVSMISHKLKLAEDLLKTKSLSGGAVFASAFFILLREGLEALLIVAALVAFLVKTERRDGLFYIHFGWIGALVLGVATWWASVSLVNISGATREITEGVAAIVATVVLLYVGFWMHDKTSAAKWKKFIDDSMHKALSSGTLWTLAGLSFIAVYREAFETILFYQALWAQTNEAGKTMGLSGFITAVALLVVLGWLIMRYSVRLPLRQFFAVTGGLMFVLAVIFAGKGVSALQEAGILTSTPVNFIRIDLLGVYPNMQGLLVQLGLILIALILWNKKSSSTQKGGNT